MVLHILGVLRTGYPGNICGFLVNPGKCLDNPQIDSNHLLPLLSQSITHYCHITVGNINNAVENGKLNEGK